MKQHRWRDAEVHRRRVRPCDCAHFHAAIVANVSPTHVVMSEPPLLDMLLGIRAQLPDVTGERCGQINYRDAVAR